MSYAIAMFSVHTSPLDDPGRTKDAGGMNVYIRELARALAQRHLSIDIFTRWTDPTLPQIVQLYPHVRVIHIQAGPLAPLHKHDLYQYMALFAHNVEEFRQRENLHYALVHSHYWLAGLVAMKLACLWNVAHVTMFHTLARLKQTANPDGSEPATRLAMEQKLVQRADRIIAATADERTQIMRYYGVAPQHVATIPCGVDLHLFQPYDKRSARVQLALPFHHPIVLFAGRLDPFKGPDLLLHAAALLEEDVHIVIVGGMLAGDDEVMKLRALAADLQIDARVHFLGARPQQHLPLLYSAADVTVVPSYHETFGMAAIESQACGTPVVATRAGGLTTAVRDGETGFLVERGPGFFAERIDALLRDTALHAAMSAACRDAVVQFSWQAIAQQVDELYTALVDDDEPCDVPCLVV